MQVTGAFKTGKTFQCNETGRWAKVTVTVTKISKMVIITATIGRKDESQAFDVVDFEQQSKARDFAINYVTKGWY